MSDEKTCEVSLAQLRARANSSRSACFVVIAGSEIGRMYKFDSVELVIGRTSEAAIQIQDSGVSRRHAKVVLCEDENIELLDLASTNGTFCNGERVSRRLLQDGDRIQIGTTTILKFSYQDNLEEEFQRRQYDSAVRDGLTHCYNKKYFLERLPGDFAFAKRHASVLSLAMMDIDHFKRINDTHGHQAGDYVLRSVARLIQDSVRADDVFARYGGEEFVLIMRNTLPVDAAAGAERLRHKVEQEPFMVGDQRICVTISIGIAACRTEGPDSPEALIRNADQQLYRAKDRGRNRVEVEEL